MLPVSLLVKTGVRSGRLFRSGSSEPVSRATLHAGWFCSKALNGSSDHGIFDKYAVRGRPMWGLVRIPEGQRFAVWSRLTGTCVQVDGPQRLWSFGSRVEPLPLYTAGPDEYLRIALRDGVVEFSKGPVSVWEDPLRHIRVQTLPAQLRTAGPAEYLKIAFRDGEVEFARGPASVREDPLRHKSVEVLQALEVDSNEAIVVYREEGEEGGQRAVCRSVLRGPMLYVPTCHERLHTFSWHGTDPKSLVEDIQTKIPKQLCFRKLRLTPDQIYFDAPEIRTKDDARIAIKVLLFTHIADVERMLDATHDPISELANALTADLVDFAGDRTFEAFKAATDELNVLSTYPNLVARSDLIGFELSKVVFRGYLSSERLQHMHDQAIHKHTELQLQKATQEQEQDLRDFKLERDAARAERLADFKMRRAQEREVMEKASVEHHLGVQDTKDLAELARNLRSHKQSARLTDERHTQLLRHKAEEYRCQADHYGRLRELGVDLSRYLAVVARGPPHRFIEVGGGIGRDSTQLHVHTQDDECSTCNPANPDSSGT